MFATVPVSLQVPGIAGAADDLKAARFRESNQGVPIFLAGAEPRGKFLRRKELVVGGAGGIVDFLHKILQPCPIAQRQNNVEAQGLGCRKLSDELCLPVDNHIAHMARQQGLGLGLSWDCEQQEHGRADKRKQCRKVGRVFLVILLSSFSNLSLRTTVLKPCLRTETAAS